MTAAGMSKREIPRYTKTLRQRIESIVKPLFFFRACISFHVIVSRWGEKYGKPTSMIKQSNQIHGDRQGKRNERVALSCRVGKNEMMKA